MLNALAAPIDANRRPEFMGAVTHGLMRQARRDRAGGTARPIVSKISGRRRQISVKGVSGLEVLATPRAAWSKRSTGLKLD